MVVLPQEDVLIYRRAETANREVLALLQHITAAATPLHDDALAHSLRLEALLEDILRNPVEANPDPPATY